VFKKPLVFVNTERQAKRRAFELALEHAAASGAPVRLVDVVDDSTWEFGHLGAKGREAAGLIAKEKLARLDALRKEAEANGATVSTAVLHGPAFVEVIREVLRNGHDAVYKTLMGEDEAVTTSFGGLGRRLLRKCPCPVFLVHQRLKHIQRVVAAVGSEQPGTSDVTPRVIEMAERIAAMSGAKAQALHAWRPYGETMLTGYMSTDEIDAYIDAEHQAARTRILEIARASSNAFTEADVHLKEGSPQRVIPNEVADAEGDLLVIGTIARSGIKGLLIGNTAERILDQAQCSLIAVKPSGFECPVSLD
jgi:nucleotide-binding universal stress UspA family protein